MISFASLFVGFVVGIVNVQLLASGGVERIELILDGQPVAELREPFKAPLDLGCEPSPHELVAVAYDVRGRELDRVRQWINRPRATADASLVLEDGHGGLGRFARVVWRALEGEVPVDVTATFDGTPIRVSDPSRIELPAHDPSQVHFLRTVARFGEGTSAAAELVFGGSRMAETRTELTAVAVEVEEGAALPANGLLAGWLEAKGELLEVAAVENGGTDLVFVTEGRALAELRPAYRTWDRWPRPYEFARDSTSEGLRFRFIRPVCRISAQAEMVANVFPATDWLTRTVGRPTSFGRIASLNHRAVWKGQNQRIADAVVVAVLAAAEGNRKRAVVLLLGSDAKDGSLRTPDEAMRFARRLCVPLLVLSAGNRHGPEAKRWGAEGLIRTNWELDVAVSHLLEEADRQRVFWVEGAHLPQDVGLGPLAKGIRLAR